MNHGFDASAMLRCVSGNGLSRLASSYAFLASPVGSELRTNDLIAETRTTDPPFLLK